MDSRSTIEGKGESLGTYSLPIINLIEKSLSIIGNSLILVISKGQSLNDHYIDSFYFCFEFLISFFFQLYSCGRLIKLSCHPFGIGGLV